MQGQIIIDDLVLIQSIGKGNFGEVFLTQKKGYPQLYATKKMERKICEIQPFYQRLINEIQILKAVNHPNIVKFIDLKKSMNHWYLVTEYINGGSLGANLKKYIAMYKRAFPEDIVQHIMRQLVDAVRYLHFNKIIHRDLKLDNILVNYPTEYDKQNLNLKNCQVKLIDFGFATILNKQFTNTLLGTPNNMDPQILAQITTGVKNIGYNEKVDIWSLGTLCYEMVVGCSPFTGNNIQDLYQKIEKGNYFMHSSLSEEVVSFVDSMLKQDANERLDAFQLIKHEFLVNPVNTFHSVDVKKIKASYIPGGWIKLKSKQPKVVNNPNYNFNYWGVFTQPEIYYEYVNAQPNIAVQMQPQQQPQIQPKMQIPTIQQKPKPQPQIHYQPIMQIQNVQPQPTFQNIRPQPIIQQKRQIQNIQPQYIAQKPQQQPQQNVYYNQPTTNFGAYY